VYGLQKQFEDADKPVQELLKGRGEDEGEEDAQAALQRFMKLTQNEDFKATMRECAFKEMRLILDGAEDLTEDEMFLPMAMVARIHFLGLCDGISAALRLSSQEASGKAQA